MVYASIYFSLEFLFSDDVCNFVYDIVIAVDDATSTIYETDYGTNG